MTDKIKKKIQKFSVPYHEPYCVERSDNNGKIRKKTFFFNDIVHRLSDKPAIYTYDNTFDDCRTSTRIYMKHGKIHRDGDKPAIYEYVNGNLYKIEYYKNGKQHRKGDNPACVYFYKGGTIKFEMFMKRGKIYRSGNRPSVVWYFLSGRVEHEEYTIDQKEHREDGPASLWYYDQDENRIKWEIYMRHGVNHRDNNLPAFIQRNEKGEIVRSVRYMNGIEIPSSPPYVEVKDEVVVADICPVCKLSKEESDITSAIFVRTVPCQHMMHRDCLQSWLSMPTMTKACPVCRTNFN